MGDEMQCRYVGAGGNAWLPEIWVSSGLDLLELKKKILKFTEKLPFLDKKTIFTVR